MEYYHKNTVLLYFVLEQSIFFIFGYENSVYDFMKAAFLNKKPNPKIDSKSFIVSFPLKCITLATVMPCVYTTL